jgi:hypothetical protein
MGSLVMAQTFVPGHNPLQQSSINFFLTYWSCEVTTALLLTLLIVVKLLHMRFRLSKSMAPGEEGMANPYLSVSAILLESCALFSAFALAFIIADVRANPYAGLLLDILGQLQVRAGHVAAARTHAHRWLYQSIAPVLVIMRVSQGSGLTKETLRQTQSSRMSFAPPSGVSTSVAYKSTGSSGNSGTRVNGSSTQIDEKEEVEIV